MNTYQRLRDKKAQELFSHARVRLLNAVLLEKHGPSVVARMERQEAKQIMRQLQHLPVIPRLPK